MRLTPRQRLATYVVDCLVSVTPDRLRTAADGLTIGVRARDLRALAAELERQFPGVLGETRRAVARRAHRESNHESNSTERDRTRPDATE